MIGRTPDVGLDPRERQGAGRAVLTESQVRTIRLAMRAGVRAVDLAAEYRVAVRTIYRYAARRADDPVVDVIAMVLMESDLCHDGDAFLSEAEALDIANECAVRIRVRHAHQAAH